MTDSRDVSIYLEDAAHVVGGHATEVVFPKNERQVADVLRTASSVLPIGAQSSLTGGATPRGDTVLSLSRLRQLADAGDGGVRAGAGVTIAEINERLARRGALYPPGPTFLGATVGGTIATNAAGAGTFKYGSTRAWVDELTVVLATGDVLDLRRGVTIAHPHGYFEVVSEQRRLRIPVPRYTMPDVPKLSSGYFAKAGMDLIDLFIGAEGTLGVIVEAVLRVESKAPARCMVFATVRSRRTALALVGALRETSVDTRRRRDERGLDISAIEHMDARSLSLLREDGVDRRLGVELPADAEIGLLVTIDLPAGVTDTEAHDALVAQSRAHGRAVALRQLVALLGQFEADDAIVALPGDRTGIDRLLALREAVPLAVNARVAKAKRDVDARIEKTAADVVVPFDRFDQMLVMYQDELESRGLDGAIWGHISDGNVHPNIIPYGYADVEAGREAVLAFGRAAIRLGGAPMAEHGVGRNAIKQQLLRELYGDDGVDQMREVKRALDPEGKLAPGVLFPET